MPIEDPTVLVILFAATIPWGLVIGMVLSGPATMVTYYQHYNRHAPKLYWSGVSIAVLVTLNAIVQVIKHHSPETQHLDNAMLAFLVGWLVKFILSAFFIFFGHLLHKTEG